MKKKALIIGGIIVGVFVILTVIVPLFLPSEMAVTRSETIEASTSVVFERIDDLHIFVDWIPWGVEQDESIELEFSDPAIGQGAWYRWSSEESGHGTTTITDSVAPERVEMAIDFESKMRATNRFRLEEESDERTRVSWEITMDDGGHLVHRYFMPLMESMVGPFLSQGLSELKNRAESAVPAEAVPEPESESPPGE